jgi:hypothetical protein
MVNEKLIPFCQAEASPARDAIWTGLDKSYAKFEDALQAFD